MRYTFLDNLEQYADMDAMVFHGKSYRYYDITRMIHEWQVYCDHNTIQSGQVVALEGVCSPEMCSALLALIDRGAIIVPLTTLPAAKREEFHTIAQVEKIISIDLTSQHHTCIDTNVHAHYDLYEQLRQTASPGLVLFSSGTSGKSKAAMLNFAQLLSRYGNSQRPRRTLSFLNLDHIGGINTLFHTLSQGGAIITVAERTPDLVFRAIAEHHVHVLPTTPTFLNMVLISGVYEQYDTQSLQLITYGTEPMPPQTLDRLHRVLPHVRFKQTYGLTEVGILPTMSKDDGSLWLKLGKNGFDYKIIDNILWIRSDIAMLGYLNAEAQFDADGFFNTQDVVETDGDYIRILGRRSEIINVGGEKVYPSEVESVLLEMSNIAEATVTGRPNPVTGMVVKATVTLVQEEDKHTLATRVRQYCAQRLEPYKVPMIIEVTHTDQHSDRFKKIRRA